jgi:hypothetical protein
VVSHLLLDLIFDDWFDRHVLPDGPATRGAATSLRAEAFGWALPLVANGNLFAD